MRTLIIGFLLTLVQAIGHADIISVYQAGEEILTLSYRDHQHIRLDRGRGGYSVINGNQAVGVLKQGDNTVVLDERDMAAILDSMGTQKSVSIPDSADIILRETGEFREIAGYRGKVFEVTDGRGTYRVVLTDHPKVIAASDSFRQLIRRFATSLNNEQRTRLLALDTAFRNHPYRGLLQVEGGFRLLSLTEAQKPGNFYQIPQTKFNFSLPGLNS
jgi:regulator of extracellular matrix RemA (YlzA/DUF370 family)